MSRIDRAPIDIPTGVTVTIKGSVVTVGGELGKLAQEVEDIAVRQEDEYLVFELTDNTKGQNAKHGLYRALVHNTVVGVPEGFTKELELVGVGYRATNQGRKLDLALGSSYNILLELPQEIKPKTVNEKGKSPIAKLTSHDKQLLGQIAIKIRNFHGPGPYKGKDVKFVEEVLRREAGKSA